MKELNFYIKSSYCRDLEQEIIGAAAKLGKIKPVTLVVKVRAAIAKSAHPGGLAYMRTIAALRQEYNR
jgi:hypothetical protein